MENVLLRKNKLKVHIYTNSDFREATSEQVTTNRRWRTVFYKIITYRSSCTIEPKCHLKQ